MPRTAAEEHILPYAQLWNNVLLPFPQFLGTLIPGLAGLLLNSEPICLDFLCLCIHNQLAQNQFQRLLTNLWLKPQEMGCCCPGNPTVKVGGRKLITEIMLLESSIVHYICRSCLWLETCPHFLINISLYKTLHNCCTAPSNILLVYVFWKQNLV